VRAAGVTPADRAAARRVDGLINRLFLDPVLTGALPADVLLDTAPLCDWAFARDADLAAMSTPLDLVGVNYYQPTLVGAGRRPPYDTGPATAWPGCAGVRFHQPPGRLTAMGWPVDATGLRDVLLRVHRDYGPVPLAVTENGAAYDDEVRADGSVPDGERIAYLREHLAAVHQAVAAGVDVRGFFVWSLLDNFEWAAGYAKRFGLVHVDYRTQRRRWKDSAHWYREVIRSGAVPR
jgi:beta-glucosidase